MLISSTKALSVVAALCVNFGLCAHQTPRSVRTVMVQAYICFPEETKLLTDHMDQHHGAFPRGYMFPLLGCERFRPDRMYSRSNRAVADYLKTEAGVGIFFYTD